MEILNSISEISFSIASSLENNNKNEKRNDYSKYFKNNKLNFLFSELLVFNKISRS